MYKDGMYMYQKGMYGYQDPSTVARKKSSSNNAAVSLIVSFDRLLMPLRRVHILQLGISLRLFVSQTLLSSRPVDLLLTKFLVTAA